MKSPAPKKAKQPEPKKRRKFCIGLGMDTWNAQTLTTVGTWRRQMLSRGSAHEAAMARYKKFGHFVTVPCVVLSAVLGSAGVTTLVDDPSGDEVSQAHNVWVSIVSMIIAALTALNATLNFDVRANQHGQASRSYLRLARMVDVQLTRADHEREPASQFVDRLVFAMDNLRETSPDIEERILRHFPALVDSMDADISQQFPVINFVAQLPKGSRTTVTPDDGLEEVDL